MAENSLLFNDFNNYPTPTSDEQALAALRAEATAKKIPVAASETTVQRSERLRLQNEENRKVKDAADFYKAAEKNPALANKLYNIREAGKNDRPQTHSELKVDNEGNPYLKIYRQMEGGFFDFSIHDGKIVFNGKMDDAHMAEALDFLFRRGITNFELPQGVDKNFAETFRQTQAQRLERQGAQAAAPANDAQIAFSEPINQETITPQSWKNPAVEEKKNFKKDIGDFENWLGDANQKKKEGLSYFKHTNWDGSVEFSVYNSEDENNYKNDGKKDKNGVVKETCAYRVKLTQKDGKLNGIQFHIPNDGKIPDGLADKFAAIVKAQGATFMNFPEGLAPSDAGVFRLACARAGIIPTGIGIDENHANKMIEAASGALSEEDFVKFKYNLALQMEKNANGDPKARTHKKMQSLKDEYNFTPLKQHFENTICPELQDRIKGDKAEEVIGAAHAMRDLFDIYDAAKQATFSDLINSNLIDPQHPETKQKFLQILNQKDITPSPETKIRNLQPEQMKALFNALEVQHTKDAREKLLDKTNGLDKKDADSEVRKQVGDANSIVSEIVKDFDDKNLKGLRIRNLGSPSFVNPNNNYQRNNRNNNAGHAQIPMPQREM